MSVPTVALDGLDPRLTDDEADELLASKRRQLSRPLIWSSAAGRHGCHFGKGTIAHEYANG